jgi:hypothetical protein
LGGRQLPIITRIFMIKKSGCALFIISIIALLVWVISIFIQPILPSNISNQIVLFFAILTSILGVTASFKDFVELLHLFGASSEITEKEQDITVKTLPQIIENTLSVIPAPENLSSDEQYKLVLNWQSLNPKPNLSRFILSKRDLKGVTLVGANLSGADLSEADLSAADLRWANLSAANLRSANLQGANLYKTVFRGADVFWVDFSDTNLHESDTAGTSFDYTRSLPDKFKEILSIKKFINFSWKASYFVFVVILFTGFAPLYVYYFIPTTQTWDWACIWNSGFADICTTEHSTNLLSAAKFGAFYGSLVGIVRVTSSRYKVIL